MLDLLRKADDLFGDLDHPFWLDSVKEWREQYKAFVQASTSPSMTDLMVTPESINIEDCPAGIACARLAHYA